MTYEVIARKWRPQTFADVVGQEHIIKTLQSELLQDRMAHAYLFVGPRGIGKTTIARIFAKAMNCQKSPTAEPCCECSSCLSIAEGNALDLIEIDGASNNSVDDIRQLREEVLYSPVSNKFKVYIIDEVHMLSNQAWNALLKTIEEPPAHAKFLFATTEAHKVLATVVSRCQRFDLQRITFKLITQQLKKIAESEKISIEDEAIKVIARAADGGMRDAQSLLDQMNAFASVDNATITAEQTLAVFGLTGVAEMEKLILSILNNDKKGLITGVHLLAGQGKNLEKLFEDILSFLRGVQICLIIDDPAAILETGDDMLQIYKNVGTNSDALTIQKLLEHLSPVSHALHNALNKQVFLETILLKGMRIAHAVEIESLIARLNQLRKGEDLNVLEQIPSGTIVNKTPSAAPVITQPPVSTPLAPAAPEASIPVTTPPIQPVVSPPSSSVFPTEPPKLQSLQKNNDVEKPQPATPVSEQIPVVATPSTEPLVPPVPVTSQPASSVQQQPPIIPTPVVPVTPPLINPTPLEQTPALNKPEAVPLTQTPPVKPSPLAQSSFSSDNDLKKNDEPHQLNTSDLPTTGTATAPLLLTPKVTEEPKVEQIPVNTSEEQTEHKVLILENPKTEAPPVNKKELSPDAIWHSLILEMDHCKQPLLKAYMQEGKPESLIGATLTVVYDDDSESFYVPELQKEKNLLELRLRKITGLEGATLNLIAKKGVSSPHESIHKRIEDMAEIRKRAENNSFVKDTMDLFNGEIVDVRG